ncbi:hypothetical protein [Streptomyces zaomyceticus]|uniref:hypothetical protein n=1 Tax=Streptomyces zaomyceticus TaxID=68286 RepID=UPI0036AB2587
MHSIRTYEGEVFLCSSCGQPAYDEPGEMSLHFKEQWDGVFCSWFPSTGKLIKMDWDEMSLDGVKEQYPDTYPSFQTPVS